MQAPVRNFILREAGGARLAETLVLGDSASISETAGGLPELVGARVGEMQLLPSGGDDTARIRAALARGTDVRLGPGTFTISGSLPLGQGGTSPRGQRLIGSGAGQTTLRLTADVPAILIHSGFSGVEALRLKGPSSAASRGISTAFSAGAPTTHITLRDLVIEGMETGILLEGASTCEISSVDILYSGSHGIYVRSGIGVVIRNVQVFDADACIRVEHTWDVVCESVWAQMAQYGIHVLGASSYRLASIRMRLCYFGVACSDTTGPGVADALFMQASYFAIQVENSSDLVLNGCRFVGTRLYGLVIRNSANVVASALRLQGSPSSAHLLVESASRIFITSLQMDETARYAYDVDISAAGSRVLFGPNNLQPARINAGGNFAQL